VLRKALLQRFLPNNNLRHKRVLRRVRGSPLTPDYAPGCRIALNVPKLQYAV